MAVQSYHPEQAFKDFLALEMQGMLVIELIFLAVGLLLGCAMKQYKIAGSTAVGIILLELQPQGSVYLGAFDLHST